ncbi:MAG: hypothetical protein SO044_10160 [Agathobaculum sp.]|nr:hypothetical protein [Agathobaculum sp.]MDY3712758.1 hypothetical protein [Agathobaculum sp.]
MGLFDKLKKKKTPTEQEEQKNKNSGSFVGFALLSDNGWERYSF